MAVPVDSKPSTAIRRAPRADLAIVAGALGVAVAAALAAQLGLPKAQPLVGAIVILGIAYACSTDRRAIDTRTVAWGLGLQIVFALIVLKTAVGQGVFATFGAAIDKLLSFAGVGASFVFGPLGNSSVWGRIMTAAL